MTLPLTQPLRQIRAVTVLAMLLASLCPASSRAQSADSLRLSELPREYFLPLDVLNVRDADLRDVLRGIGESYGVSLLVDNDIQARVTFSLERMSVLDALRTIARTWNLRLEQQAGVLRVVRPRTPSPIPVVSWAPERGLTLDLQSVDVRDAARRISEATGRTIVVPQGVTGTVTAFVPQQPLESALDLAFGASGFAVQPRGTAFVVLPARAYGEGAPALASLPGLQLGADSLIHLQVEGAPVAALVEDLARRLSFDLVFYARPEHTFSGRLRSLTLEEALDYLFRSSPLTFRLDERAIVVGKRDDPAFASSKLFRLRHIPADQVLALVPAAIQAGAKVQLVPEHNALLVRGSADYMADMTRFLGEIDRPTPLVLLEALVVDFDDAAAQSIGVSFSRGLADSAAAPGSYRSDGQGGLRIDLDGQDISRAARSAGAMLGIGGIGRLPVDFYARIEALETRGVARVLSRPQVATVSGKPASISVGTTQYYLLQSTTPGSTPGQPSYYPYQSERFEKVEANVRLTVTPWVSPGGEVMALIKPEFSTPIGRLSPNVPPTIASRVLEANVRLRAGETIILGGLIQESQGIERGGVPFLSRLPLIGGLFRTRSRSSRKTELVIYLTPHVFYGDGEDDARWNDVRERLRLQDPNAPMPGDGLTVPLPGSGARPASGGSTPEPDRL